jgi:type III secretory pathway lipoprotein EscJ
VWRRIRRLAVPESCEGLDVKRMEIVSVKSRTCDEKTQTVRILHSKGVIRQGVLCIPRYHFNSEA